MRGQKKWFVLFFALLLGLAAVAGCNSAPGPGQSGNKEAPEGKVEWREIAVEDAPAAIREWVEENYQKRGHDYRFTAEGAFFLVAWGERPTGGHRVTIDEIKRGAEGLEVRATLHAPPPGAVVTQALTYPYALAFAPGLKEEAVRFSVAEAGGTKTAGQAAASSQNFRLFEPEPGATVDVDRPLSIRGQARVFEATFTIELEDGHDVLAKQVVTASAGAPEWGDFAVELKLEKVPTSPHGTLLFVTYSAEDGSRQEELVVPLKFSRFNQVGG